MTIQVIESETLTQPIDPTPNTQNEVEIAKIEAEANIEEAKIEAEVSIAQSEDAVKIAVSQNEATKEIEDQLWAKMIQEVSQKLDTLTAMMLEAALPLRQAQDRPFDSAQDRSREQNSPSLPEKDEAVPEVTQPEVPKPESGRGKSGKRWV